MQGSAGRECNDAHAFYRIPLVFRLVFVKRSQHIIMIRDVVTLTPEFMRAFNKNGCVDHLLVISLKAPQSPPPPGWS